LATAGCGALDWAGLGAAAWEVVDVDFDEEPQAPRAAAVAVNTASATEARFGLISLITFLMMSDRALAAPRSERPDLL
jgi:hypothetical protein